MLQIRRNSWQTLLVGLIILSGLNGFCLGQGYNKNHRNQQQPANRQAQRYQNAPAVGGMGEPGAGPPQTQTPPERRHTANEMIKAMNPKQDPCNDFYDYVCGNWMQSQNVSYETQEGELITVASRLEGKVIQQLQRRLEDTGRSQPVVTKFYKSCCSTNWNEQKMFIKTFVAHYGGLPDIGDTWRERSYQWFEIIAKLKVDFNLDILITFENPPNGRAVLKEPSKTILPSDLCNSDPSSRTDENDKVFEVIQTEIKEKLQSWLDFSDADANRLAGDIQRFEFDLCKYMKKDELLEVQGAEEVENATTFGPVEVRPMNKFNGTPGASRNMNMMKIANFKNANDLENNPKLITFASLCLGQSQGQGRTDFEIQNADYLQYLTSIAGRKPSFAYYIMYRALAELSLPLNLPQAERKLFCVQKAMQVFPDYLGYLYQLNVLPHMREYIKQDVASIFRDIKEAIPRSMRKNIDAIQISEPLYQQTMGEQLYTNVKTNGNYWEILKSVTINGAAQPTVPQRGRGPAPVHIQNLVEAFATHISSNERTLQYGWGLLQPPFYSYNYPKSLKYSGLGYGIARELLLHHVDEQIWEVGKHAGFSQHVDDFKVNRECFRAQVSSYLFNTPEVYRNGSQLREIMADASALSVAFLAYNNWLEKQDAQNPELKFETLPNMNFTNTQLFFVNFAQSRCADRYAMEPTEPSESFPMDLHTIERWNVNGPLSNEEEFGLDFSCDLGAEMNSADKCSIMTNDFKRGY